ncbi:hypothetical protein PISL3812_06232 [Talaromyces islandicus]|uniref:FAD-binding PCMH-type domain-containing protein n=1 Tax=Talaromyces islandicus TaxID=28573 RepID=A0A0U1M293_TALIS|nr:hypothetical protein PISL3812_06232 [Talaromyces islandicus]
MPSRLEEHHIEELRSQLPHVRFVAPNDEDYGAVMSRWNPANEQKAGAAALPTTSEEVSQLVSFARERHLEIAIKGGGCGNRGSSTDGGLCIDLSAMRAVSVDPSSKCVTAGGGALWSDVYTEIGKHNLAVVGGISPLVGVGGLSIHGGHGWLTGAHGLALDQFLELEVVLADGKIVRTSLTQEPDLFWALRGAGSAFVVVTEFVLKAFEQPNTVWTGRIVLPGGEQNLSAVIDIGNKVLSAEEAGQSAMCWGWTVLRPGSQPVIWVVPFFNGSEEKATQFFAPLLDSKVLVNSTKVVPFSASVSEGGGPSGKGLRKLGHGGAIMAPLDLALFQDLYQDYASFMSQVPDAGQRTLIMFEVHHPGATMRIKQNQTAYANRGDQVNVQFVVTWTQEENDALCEEFCRRFSGKMTEGFQRCKQQSTVDAVTRESVGICANYNGIVHLHCSISEWVVCD